MAALWISLLGPLLELLKNIAASFERYQENRRSEKLQEMKGKSENYDRLVKAIMARRKIRAKHSKPADNYDDHERMSD